MKMKNKFFFAFICFVSANGILFGQSVSFKINKPSKVEFAGSFNINIETLYPQNYSLKPDKKRLDLKNFGLVSAKEENPVETQDETKRIFVLSVMPFALGKIDFPALDWILKNVETGETMRVKSPKFPIEITEIKKPENLKGEIYDIFDIYHPFNYLFLYIAAVAVLILGFLIYMFKYKRKKSAAGTIVDKRSAHAIALEQIDKLLNSNLWKSGKIKMFYIEMSEIARDYIQKHFQVQAHRLTTYDLHRKLNKVLKDKNLLGSIRTFFSSCDMVKFAKNKPSDEEKSRDVENLRYIINKTLPKTCETDLGHKL
jgi:hypothetical protein